MEFLLKIWDLIPALVVLGILVFIHELGHFLACRHVGVRVEKFSIGFGPEILVYQGKETRYALSLIPLGGFVKPSGESLEDAGGKAIQPYDFLAKPAYQRFYIAIAGVMMNFFLAFALFSAVYCMGKPVLNAKIGGFVENFPAVASALQKNDTIHSVNGQIVKNWNELIRQINQAAGNTLRLEVSQNGATRTVDILPKIEEQKDIFGKTQKVARLGILPADEYIVEKYGLLKSLARGAETTVQTSAMTFKAIGYLLTGRMSVKAMTGPIGIFAITSETAKRGLVHVFQLAAFLSVSLAVFNFIPMPPLDGGLMLFLLYEMTFRKEMNLKAQDLITKSGVALLLLLMLVVVFNDLASIGLIGRIQALFS